MERLRTRSTPYDLAVIGGGPAGTSAAITAARYGARVLLLEKGSFPRQKVCGEFVSAESLELLSSLLSSSSGILECAPRISKGRMFVQTHCLEVPVDPPAASISRFDLDAALWKSAKSAGVEAWESQTVENISGTSAFLIATQDNKFEARSVINASGRWSNFARKELPAGPKWLGLKAHYLEPQPVRSVDLYFFEHGYCGVQPVACREDAGGHVINACAMVRADVASSLTEVFRLHPALAQRSSLWRPMTEPVTTSPLIFRKPEPVRDRILQAGDAAGFVDPFVGDGISLALRSGAFAARSLYSFISGSALLDAAADDYLDAYSRLLLPVFRTSSGIRMLLRMPEPVISSILILFQALPSMTKYLLRKTRG